MFLIILQRMVVSVSAYACLGACVLDVCVVCMSPGPRVCARCVFVVPCVRLCVCLSVCVYVCCNSCCVLAWCGRTCVLACSVDIIYIYLGLCHMLCACHVYSVLCLRVTCVFFHIAFVAPCVLCRRFEANHLLVTR